MSLVLQSVAITVVFAKGAIFKSVRENGPTLWKELAGCPLCAGVWIGAAWHVLRTLLAGGVFSTLIALDALAAGAATGVLALVTVLVLALLDRWS